MTVQTDHVFYVVWTLVVCALAVVFGALHIAAAAVQMSRDHKPMHIVMITGGALCILAAVSCVFGGLFGFGGVNLDALLMAVGGGAVCGAAWYNGKKLVKENGDKGRFHLAHHITRFALVLILVMNFIRV